MVREIKHNYTIVTIIGNKIRIIEVIYFSFLSYFFIEFMEFITASIVAIFDKKGDQ